MCYNESMKIILPILIVMISMLLGWILWSIYRANQFIPTNDNLEIPSIEVPDIEYESYNGKG